VQVENGGIAASGQNTGLGATALNTARLSHSRKPISGKIRKQWL
jgi:hypothetical protein